MYAVKPNVLNSSDIEKSNFAYVAHTLYKYTYYYRYIIVMYYVIIVILLYMCDIVLSLFCFTQDKYFRLENINTPKIVVKSILDYDVVQKVSLVLHVQVQ